MSDFEQIDLAELDNKFESEEASETNHTPVPDGKYQVNVDKIELTRSKSGNPMLKWTLRIIGPTQRKRLLWKNSVITEASIKWLKRDLIIAGLVLAKLSDLEHRLHELLDIQLEVKKVTKNDYENIYLQRLIEIDDPDAQASTQDSVPF
ncbi:DUF669 domain-containing protein [Sulfidibacter corallicola]|uniref:DUF669 domain-containing protein n=1 Tax=Sulfidibacter corallicola TaxID=2818388 RepID=A0A8A4TW26_SULCO|nr:DUF669 domain-containing protein [Sulfidibacter corallicola]QTD54166.1 DUF669 domain-containing protein [Sulfidibacter corallicola]